MKPNPNRQSKEARHTSRCTAFAALVTAIVLALVSATALVAGDSEKMPVQYTCSGNEPFWNLEIDGTHARLSRMGETERYEGGMKGHFRSMDYAGVFSWRGPVSEQAPGDLVVFIVKQLCLDTMADAEEGGGAMEFSVGLSIPDGTVLLGCCRAAEETDPPDSPFRDKEKSGDSDHFRNDERETGS